MSAGLPIPGRVFGHGFLTKDGQKMGKSLGNTVDPFDLVARYGSDAVRYYFIKEIELGRDGDFAETRFVNILNADLANDLGNLLNRTLRMVHKYCGGAIPNISAADIPSDDALKAAGTHLSKPVIAAYNALAFSQACNAILDVVRMGNKYIDEQAPWKLYKEGNSAAVEQILYSVLETVRQAACLLSPVIPTISNRIYHQLGFSVDFHRSDAAVDFSSHIQWGTLPAGQAVENPEPVFQRLELPE
jgi:methionyl-tRNA synthetase